MSDRIDILSELSELGSKLGNIPNGPVFNLPEGFFEDFPSKMVEIVKKEERSGVQEELESISPLLASLSKKSPFSVPEGYFEDQVKIPVRPIEHEPAKIVSMKQTSRLRMLYAAAGITALLGLFTLLYYTSGTSRIGTDIAAVNIHSELPKVSANEISEYLSNIPEDIDTETISLAGIEEADFNEIMNEIHESELQQFINENPGLEEKNLN